MNAGPSYAGLELAEASGAGTSASGLTLAAPVSVMLVDDRPDNLLALEAVLEPLGENLVRAGSGEEALRHALREDFAVILLDVQMPGIDGFEAARLIRQRPRTREIPIVFLTALSKDERNVFEGYESGAVDYIVKPFEPLVLRAKVRVFAELHRRRRALEESEERFRRSFDDAPIGMALIGIDGRWLRVNHRLCELTGYTPGELIGNAVGDITPYARELEAERAQARRAIAGEVSGYRLERRYIRADGEAIWVHLSMSLVRDPSGRALHFISQVEDISQRKMVEENAAAASMRDPLTTLASRALLIDRTELALARLRRRGTRIAMLFLNLDRFKQVNEGLGHGSGDHLLVNLAARLRATTRESDTVARLGGDSYVVLSEDLGSEHTAITTSERLAHAIREPFELGGEQVSVTASIGVAITDDAGTAPEVLVSDAEAAMQRAKARGGDRFELFDEAMRTRARERLSTETALRRAVERGELRLLYQPVVRLSDGAVTGVEALARWHHPERGIVSPADFVPLAEETGLILPIGRWVLEEACREAARWRTAGHELTVSVNISACQLAAPELPDAVAAALSRGGAEPHLVCLEVTESVLMEDAPSMTQMLEQLKQLGVCLAVDDFGTGYSSLSYLHRFPVDILKIDRSFVEGLGSHQPSSPIVEAIVAMARALGLGTVAEGVETEDQLSALLALGAAEAQGFLFARPRSADTALGGLDFPAGAGH